MVTFSLTKYLDTTHCLRDGRTEILGFGERHVGGGGGGGGGGFKDIVFK